MLIAIEGIDGSGKATQAGLLCRWLQQRSIEGSLLSFPRYDHTFFGSEVKKYLRGCYGSLQQVDPRLSAILYAGDRFETLPVIQNALRNRRVLICDRYTPSNVAHQSAKLSGGERQAFQQWIEKLEYDIFGLPKPDVVIWLDMNPNVAQTLLFARGKRQVDIHEENIIYLQQVREVYAEMALSQGWRKIECYSPLNKIKDMMTVHTEITHAIKDSFT
jgi:dTMP kinase